MHPATRAIALALLSAAGIACVSGCGPAVENAPESERLADSVMEKLNLSIEGLEDPDLFVRSFDYLCDVGKPAVPHLLAAIDTDNEDLRRGLDCVLEGITGHRVEATRSARALAKRWSDWWAKNRHREMPVPGPRPSAGGLPAAEVVPAGPRASGSEPPGERLDPSLWPAGRQAKPGELPDWLKDSPKAGPASEDAKARARERMLKLIEEGKKPLENAPPAEDAEGPGKAGEARAPGAP